MLTKEEFDKKLMQAWEFFLAFVLVSLCTAAIAILILMVFP